ncbi:MAG: hypothetical protein JWP63_1837 [Candidatus Solibacter sp.]|jgi:hypothetical protein|nr:hypothetical protein [Candidatus Solibacter sp.]
MPDNTPKSNRLRGLASATLCLSLLGFGLAPLAHSDEWNKKTIITTNEPVEIPGKVLPPGTYVFKLLDSPSNRNIVQILDKDEKEVYATILAVPDYRLEPADKTLLQFEERPSNTPPAIKAWFYPGEQYGYQFVYPHQRAVQLAKQNNHNVLSMKDDVAKNMKTKSTSANSSDIQGLQKTEVNGVNPSGEPVVIEAVVAVKPAK